MDHYLINTTKPNLISWISRMASTGNSIYAGFVLPILIGIEFLVTYLGYMLDTGLNRRFIPTLDTIFMWVSLYQFYSFILFVLVFSSERLTD